VTSRIDITKLSAVEHTFILTSIGGSCPTCLLKDLSSCRMGMSHDVYIWKGDKWFYDDVFNSLHSS